MATEDPHGALQLPRWPGGAAATVCLTVDVDANVAAAASTAGAFGRSSQSHGRFGVERGLGRILDVLERLDLPATFYVPGWIAARYPSVADGIDLARHEVAHHGYLHLRPDRCSPVIQADEIARGVEALAQAFGERPTGYRSPSWELTDATLQLLLDHGFAYDSSCMGDDRPYYEVLLGRKLLELPVHWSLDDWPYFGFTGGPQGLLSGTGVWCDAWASEVEHAATERRVVTFTVHPEVVGRGYRMIAFERLLRGLVGRGDLWFARHGDVARLVEGGTH